MLSTREWPKNARRGIAAGGVALMTMGGVAWATIPAADGTIKGCYARTEGLLGIPHSKGDVRVVDSGESCRSYETLITWNQRGPAGPQGPAGTPGLPGPGVSSYKTATTTAYIAPEESSFRTVKFLFVSCPNGTLPVSGSIFNRSDNNGVNTNVSIVESDRIGTGWDATVRADASGGGALIGTTVTLEVLCGPL